MSLEIGGRLIEFPLSACPSDEVAVVTAVTRGANKGRRVPRATDGRRRKPKDWTSGFVVHTTSGTVRLKKKGLIESIRDWIYAAYQANTDRHVSWHLTGDTDGSWIQSASDRWTCWHASQVNPFTDSVELVQGEGRVLTEVQLNSFVYLMDTWTYHTGIPRVIPWRDGRPYAGMLTRALSAYGAGRTLCCVYGHRNVWYLDAKDGRLKPYRGAGDPSDLPFEALADAGYLKLDVERGEDLEYWKEWQAKLRLDPDGVPGPATRRALITHGLPGGMVVARPGDEARGAPAWALAA